MELLLASLFSLRLLFCANAGTQEIVFEQEHVYSSEK